MRSEWKQFYRKAFRNICVIGIIASMCVAVPFVEAWAAQATKADTSGGTKTAPVPAKTAAKRPTTPKSSAAPAAREAPARPASSKKTAASSSKKASAPKPAASATKASAKPTPPAAPTKPAAGATKSASAAPNPGPASKSASSSAPTKAVVTPPTKPSPPVPGKPGGVAPPASVQTPKSSSAQPPVAVPDAKQPPVPAVKAPAVPTVPSAPPKVVVPPVPKPPAGTSAPETALSRGANARSLPPAGQKAPAIRPGVRKNTEKPSRQFGLRAFGVEPPAKTQQPLTAKRTEPSANASKADEPKRDDKVTFSAERQYPAEGVAPRRAPLPGGRDTMSHIDGLPPPEVAMRYKMENGTAARVMVNPQDQGSPIYAPVRPGSNVEGAGVYMDMDVAKNLQFQVGGEVRNFEGNPGDVPGESAGASMGFKLNF